MSDSRTQSVCKHCQRELVRRPADRHNWYDSQGSVWCNATRYKSTHEPVAEPASTGEPPAERFFRGDGVEEKVTYQPVTFSAARPSGLSAPPLERQVCGMSVDDKGTECQKKPLHNGRCSVHPEPSAPPCQHLHRRYIAGNTYCDDCKVWLHAGSVEAAPQTSAEPTCLVCGEVEGNYRHSTETASPHYYHKFNPAPQPVSDPAPSPTPSVSTQPQNAKQWREREEKKTCPLPMSSLAHGFWNDGLVDRYIAECSRPLADEGQPAGTVQYENNLANGVYLASAPQDYRYREVAELAMEYSGQQGNDISVLARAVLSLLAAPSVAGTQPTCPEIWQSYVEPFLLKHGVGAPAHPGPQTFLCEQCKTEKPIAEQYPNCEDSTICNSCAEEQISGKSL